VGRAKNIIFMVPDGMGLSNVTAARIFRGGPDGDNLYFENLAQIGYQRTHSRNSTVTDSAAAAATWACGEKFNNSETPRPKGRGIFSAAQSSCAGPCSISR
jgi:alkaline phosphatase